MNRRKYGHRIAAGGVKVFSGPFATVYQCPYCSLSKSFRNGVKGTGRGHGLRQGGTIHSQMRAHMRAAHPEKEPSMSNPMAETITDRNAKHAAEVSP